MKHRIAVDSPAGRREFDAAALPLSIGSSPDCLLRVPGATDVPALGQISELDEQALLQPAPGARLSLNGEALGSARWLADGDVVSTDTARINCAIRPDSWEFRITHAEDAYQTLPPELAAAEPGDEPVITAVARRRGRAASATPQAAKKPGKALRYLAGAALVLLCAVALFLFTAKAVRIQVEPGEAEVQLVGAVLKPYFGGRYLLWPGEYRVLLEADGYRDVREQISVTGESSQEFRFAMQKLPGLLVVRTAREATGTVWIDGEAAGTTPTPEIELPAGPHELRIEAERYLPFQAQVDITGLGQRQEFVAELSPAWGEVTIRTVPPAAQVFADDVALATTPGTVELAAGAHELVIRLEGYRPWRELVTVAAGQQLELPEISLRSAAGILTVISDPPGAAVSIDGRYRGTTPVDAELKPGGSYELIVTKAGYATVKRTVSLPDRQARSVRLSLESVVGEVRVVGVADDATVLVDGREVGRGDQQLELPARPHELLVRRPGYADFKTRVTPKPDLPQLIEVRMLTEAEAILARTPRTVTTSQGTKLVLIDPGEFEMGAPRRQQGRRPNEVQRQVRLTRRFYIATREVTNSEYRAFIPTHTSGAESFRELGIGDHPAVMLSWDDAASFCNWLSAQDDLKPAYVARGGAYVLVDPPTSGYRLPTEAEWVWVARYNAGGKELKYPWGDRMPPTKGAGNFADVSARGILTNVLSNYDDGYPVTAPPASFTASPLGIYDLGGNVSEWVHDLYEVSVGTSDVEVDPLGAGKGQYHVIRGSSWRQASISELRFAYRDFGDRGRLDVGFRLARWADGKDDGK